MSKKSPHQEAKERRLIAWYKWEFLRRNPDYRRDFKVFFDNFGDWFSEHGHWHNENVIWNQKERSFFEKRIAPKIVAICQRWQIREPLPPSRTRRHHYNRPGILVVTECSKEEAGQGWNPPDFLLLSKAELLKRIPESTAFRYGPKPDYQLELEFDLRRPLDSLLRDAADQITSRKRKYVRKHPSIKITPAVRRRLDLYDTYLKVWDLKTSGEKFDYIGALLFPGNPVALQRAKDGFMSAKKLIEGGYKELK
jgi:hypothetical protein